MVQRYDIDESKGYPSPSIVPDDLGSYVGEEDYAALEKRCEELVAENIRNLEKYIEVQNKLKADNALLRKIVSNLHRNECLNGIDVELMYPVKRVLFEKLMTFTYIRVV